VFPSGWCTYMLICVDGSYYVGLTHHLAQRVSNHAHGKGSGYTRGMKPFVLAWYESHSDRAAAEARERQIKSWSRKKKNQLARGTAPSLSFGVRPWLRFI